MTHYLIDFASVLKFLTRVFGVCLLLVTPTFAENLNIPQHLHQLAQDGDAQGVIELIQTGVDVNVTYNSTEKRFLGNKTCSGMTALFDATSRGHAAIVRTLIDAGAHVDATMKCGGFLTVKTSTALSVAAYNGNMEIVQMLVENGVRLWSGDASQKNLHFFSSDGNNPVTEAIKGQHGEVALYLLKHGGRPIIGDFIKSVKLNHLGLIQGLLAAGTGACERESVGNRLADIYALELGHMDMAKYLQPLIETCPPLQENTE